MQCLCISFEKKNTSVYYNYAVFTKRVSIELIYNTYIQYPCKNYKLHLLVRLKYMVS